MIRQSTVCRGLALAAALLFVLLGTPAVAQMTGMVKGKVVDGEGKPVEGAKIIIEFADGMARKFETKTNKKGEFIQIGLNGGNYNVTAEKEKVGTQTFSVRVRIGGATEVNFQLSPAATAAGRPLTKEETAKLQAFKTSFEAGVAATNANNFDEAVAKFEEALTQQPDCYACQFNIGGALMQKASKTTDEEAKKAEYARAEEAFNKAMQMKPDSAEPYNALANIYNAQRRFDEAAKMTEEATKRAGADPSVTGNPDQLFNQGVILWNAGKTMEAKKQFEAALALKPDMAEAHYWVGMAHLNEGKAPDAVEHFEEYLKLAPTGQYAETAKGVLAQIKKL